MLHTVSHGTLSIHPVLYDFVANEVLPNTGVSIEQFWSGFETTLDTLAPINQHLLDKRDWFQTHLDTWYKAHKGKTLCPDTHALFLRSIGYLVESTPVSPISTLHVDPEIALIAGPQLVVPADNARYALNAANARWGSLLDVFYGTDIIDNIAPYAKEGRYNPKRGEKVFEHTYAFLDQYFPLASGSYEGVTSFCVVGNQLNMTHHFGHQTGLRAPEQWVGFRMQEGNLCALLFKHHGLHVEIVLDANTPIGKSNPAGISDVLIESALSAIQDCEDSVAAVDAEDKVAIYRNWNGLMKGDLSTTFENKGQTIQRKLNPDKTYTTPSHETLCLKGRVLLLVRNVGIHMYTDALTCKGQKVPEGFLDAFITTACAMHDLAKTEGLRNSVQGSVYIVKPKCHGPEEIAFVGRLFGCVEAVLGLPLNTIKMGIMDEERRTSVNLQACIQAASERVFFINTGFLDRTGDEIHSCMDLGAVVPKEEIKKEVWLKAYEDQNVDIGLALGFHTRAQIGKGMWTMPDAMKKMLEIKIAHPLSGASTAWVPSPTAGTLHALHYHKVDVFKKQEEIKEREKASLDALLTPPMLKTSLSETQKRQEIENNIQSILGYVVRWVDQGIGCSKVPDINNIELMEDRATLRISSQHLANWLHHGIVSHDEVREAFEKMAVIVDAQNKADKKYQPMAPRFQESIAFQAACDLVFQGRIQPNGYTEPILHTRRQEVKQGQ